MSQINPFCLICFSFTFMPAVISPYLPLPYCYSKCFDCTAAVKVFTAIVMYFLPAISQCSCLAGWTHTYEQPDVPVNLMSL